MTKNNEELRRLYDEAGRNLGVTQPLGEIVICDICDGDWTNRTESGGFLRGSYAYCPDCAPNGMESLRKYNELHHIKAECPPSQSFANWVRELRGPSAGITVTRGSSMVEIMEKRAKREAD